MSAKKLSVATLFGVCLLGFGTLAWAQDNRGAISGTVADASGAVVPGVTITATDVAQGVKYPATSGAGGVFTIPNLVVGDYRVEAQMAGFKAFVVENVSVITGTTTTVNIALQVGASTQQVTVSAAASPLQTNDASVSYELSHKMYQDLPLTMNGNSIDGSGRRQPNQFILLMPGVDTDIEGDTLGRMFNGAQYYQGLFKIDGIATTISIDAGQAEFYAPPYEAMQDFSVQTSNLPAELGGGSGVESLTMKSGTNQIHGNVFEFHRDDALNARGFNPVPVKSLFIQNEYGFAIGGPISIPHIYSGHNRSFFFVTWGQFRNVGGPPSAPVYTVPTAAEKAGNFSQELSVLGTQIYNPATTTPNGSTYTRTPFANNQVGPIVPQAAYWLKWIAAPNLPGTNGGLTSNFVDTVGNLLHDNTWSAKIDHSFSDRNRISYSYWGVDRPQKSIADVYFSVPISVSSYYGGGQRLHDYYTFGANIQNDAYAGYSTYYQRGGVCAPGSQLGDNPAGIPNLDYYNPQGTGQYRWANGYFRSGGALQGCVPFGTGGKYKGRNSNSLVAGDSLGWLHGKHAFKFGLEYTHEDTTFRGLAGGNYTFSNLETDNPTLPANTGDSFASFLLGYTDGDTLNGPNIGIQWHNPRMGAFAQDTWKITSKLTVNYGLRWDRTWISTEDHDRIAGFSPTAINPAYGIPGAEVFLGTGSGRTGTRTFPGQHASNLHFGPRIGFAYSPDAKTVIRTGYALMYTYGNGDALLFDNGGTPWQSYVIKDAVNFTSSNGGVTPADTLQVGLPVPTCALPCYNANAANGAQPLYWDPNSGRDPYLQQWTFGIERYLPGGFFIQAAYIGNKGNNLTGDINNQDQLPVSDLATYGTLLTQSLASQPQLGIKLPYAGFTGSVGQALRPFPQYSGITDRFDPSGMNRYDSFQMSLRRQMGALQTMINFTDAKNLSDVGAGASNGTFTVSTGSQLALDTHNIKLEKAVDSLTPARRLVITWLYAFPVGRGKRFGTNMPKVLDEVIGGWQFGAIQTYRTGFYDGVSGGVATAGIFNTETRPNELAGVPVRLSGCNNIVLGSNVLANINAFSTNTTTTLGDAPKLLPNFRGCAWLDEDTTLQKQFPITEKVHFMIRVDVYNTFNRVKFGDPSLNINSPATFGRITAIDGNFQPREFQLSGKITF